MRGEDSENISICCICCWRCRCPSCCRCWCNPRRCVVAGAAVAVTLLLVLLPPPLSQFCWHGITIASLLVSCWHHRCVTAGAAIAAVTGALLLVPLSQSPLRHRCCCPHCVWAPLPPPLPVSSSHRCSGDAAAVAVLLLLRGCFRWHRHRHRCHYRCSDIEAVESIGTGVCLHRA